MVEYNAWKNMRAQCHYKGCPRYKKFGALGISVCKRWNESFQAFLEDMGSRPSPEHFIDRTNKEGDFSPDNCVWAIRPQRVRLEQKETESPLGFEPYLPEKTDNYLRIAVSIARKYCARLAEWEDFRSEALMAVALAKSNHAKHNSRAPFMAYLSTTVHMVMKTYLRTKTRLKRGGKFATVIHLSSTEDEDKQTLADFIEAKTESSRLEVQEELEPLLCSLSSADRHLLWRYFGCDDTAEQIGRDCGMAQATVRSQANRLMKGLRYAIDAEASTANAS